MYLCIACNSGLSNRDSHTKPGSITSYIYHGKQKQKLALQGHFDVVITTFKTLAMQWEKSQTAKSHSNSSTGPLFSVLWHRVILDEGDNTYQAFQYTANSI